MRDSQQRPNGYLNFLLDLDPDSEAHMSDSFLSSSRRKHLSLALRCKKSQRPFCLHISDLFARAFRFGLSLLRSARASPELLGPEGASESLRLVEMVDGAEVRFRRGVGPDFRKVIGESQRAVAGIWRMHKKLWHNKCRELEQPIDK
jgi:hypothetical protein